MATAAASPASRRATFANQLRQEIERESRGGFSVKTTRVEIREEDEKGQECNGIVFKPARIAKQKAGYKRTRLPPASTARHEQVTGQDARHLERFGLGDPEIPHLAMQGSMNHHRECGARAAQVRLSEPKKKVGDHKQQEDIDHRRRPHYSAKQLGDSSVRDEDARRFVVPEIAIQLLALEQALSDGQVGSLVAAQWKAQDGERSYRHK